MNLNCRKYSAILFFVAISVNAGNNRPAPVFELKPDGKLVSESKIKRFPQYQIPKRQSINRTNTFGKYRPGKKHNTAGRQMARGSSRGKIHIVKKGETIKSIAKLYQKDFKYLVYINRLKPPYQVFKGQALIIEKRQGPTRQRLESNSRRLNAAIQKNKINPIQYVTSSSSQQKRLLAKAGGGKSKVRYKVPYPGPKSKQEIARLDTSRVNNSKGIKRYRIEKSANSTKFDDNSNKTTTKLWKQTTIKKNDLNLDGDPIGQRKDQGKVTTTASIGKRSPTTNSTPRVTGEYRKKQTTRRKQTARARIFQGRRLVRWSWPARGRISKHYTRHFKGIDIAGRYGQAVKAAASGQVVYIGNSLVRYGNLVIIKHSKSFFSAYAHNKRILVNQGQIVDRGDKIAEMGSTGTSGVKLHFEIRKDGKAVNPLRYLQRYVR